VVILVHVRRLRAIIRRDGQTSKRRAVSLLHCCGSAARRAISCRRSADVRSGRCNSTVRDRSAAATSVCDQFVRIRSVLGRYIASSRCLNGTDGREKYGKRTARVAGQGAGCSSGRRYGRERSVTGLVFTPDCMHYMYSAITYTFAIVRPSVTRVDQSKTRIMIFSPYGSPSLLVLRGKFYPEILTGVGRQTREWWESKQFLPRDALQCKARSCDRMSSVCLSVCNVGEL